MTGLEHVFLLDKRYAAILFIYHTFELKVVAARCILSAVRLSRKMPLLSAHTTSYGLYTRFASLC